MASTEVRADDQALLDDAPAPHYPVYDVREMAQYELHQPMNNLSFKVAIGTALPCLPGSLHHSLPIPPGYARVTVDDIVEDFADLEIEIATPEGLTKLGDVKRNIILWNKKYIKFPGSAPRPPTPRNPNPPRIEYRQPPSPPQPDYRQPTSPPRPVNDRRSRSTSTRSPPPCNTRSPPPPLCNTTTSSKKRKFGAPPRPTSKKGQTPKIVDIPPDLPKRPYDKTDEETNTDVAAQVKAHFAPKKPDPKPVYNEKTKKWAKSFLEQPSQISMNLESDYDREIIKQAQKKKITSAKSGKQVAQLGAQKNQSVAPLKVISDLDKAFRAEMDMDMQIMDPRARNNAALMGITVSQAKALANEENMSLGQYLGYEDTPVGQIVRQYVQGEPLVSNEELARLSTHAKSARMVHVASRK